VGEKDARRVAAEPADYDRCTAVLAWHIDSGQVDDTDVAGLSVVLLLDAPKQMSEGDWRVGMFMDDRASAGQSEKLGAISSGAMGGPMANLTPLISENLGMEVAPIEHVDDGRRHRVKVGSAVEVDIEDVVSPLDPDGPPPKITESASAGGTRGTGGAAMLSPPTQRRLGR